MWNSVSVYKQYRHRPGVSSDGWATAAALVTGLLSAVAWAAALSAGTAHAGAQGRPAFRVPGTPAPALAKQFTPRHAPAGAYEVVVLEGGIQRAREQVLEAVRSASATVPPGEALALQSLDPLQAFGRAGTYSQTTVARLYTGRKANVVRIPVEQHGRTIAAITLISPYPDPTLSRLEEGTMLILLNIDELQ
jgi:hypothetical protein